MLFVSYLIGVISGIVIMLIVDVMSRKLRRD